MPAPQFIVSLLPRQLDDYVHRIGRTGRAGRKAHKIGEAASAELRMFSALGLGLTFEHGDEASSSALSDRPLDQLLDLEQGGVLDIAYSTTGPNASTIGEPWPGTAVAFVNERCAYLHDLYDILIEAKQDTPIWFEEMVRLVGAAFQKSARNPKPSAEPAERLNNSFTRSGVHPTDHGLLCVQCPCYYDMYCKPALD
ncbi:hhoA [Symbiodinium sp. CCMP2592]|nr:hhoA [Symbiodinium sp. CCMP2592]